MVGTKKIFVFFFLLLMLIITIGTSIANLSNNELIKKSVKESDIENKDAKLFSLHNEENNKKDKRFIIIYKDDIANEDISNLEGIGAKIKHEHRILNAVTIDFGDKNEDYISKHINYIKSRENVKDVFEDIRVYASLFQSVPQINADDVHALNITGNGVKVCIPDTGIDDTHPALNSLVAEYDFVNNDSDAMDDNGHGTHVAGIVASTDSVYKGVAYGAKLMGAKVLDADGSGWASDVILGIEWCVENEADIISLSLGGGVFVSNCDSEPLAQASNNAVDAGAVVFAASGNDGYINGMVSPACGSKVIAVGAVNKDDSRTWYSNEGSELDIVAPGTYIFSTKLGGDFERKTGTSMAAPHVSGTAALMLEKNPFLTPSGIRDILTNTALDLGDSGFDTIYGYGRVDAYAAYNATSLPVCTVSGIGMNTPSAPKWRASMSLNINESNLTNSNLRYYYTRQRINLLSTSISVLSVMENTAEITGTGDAAKYTGGSWSYCNGCSFTATIKEGNPDMMDIEIDNGSFYNAPGSIGEDNTKLDRGNFNIECQ